MYGLTKAYVKNYDYRFLGVHLLRSPTVTLCGFPVVKLTDDTTVGHDDICKRCLSVDKYKPME